MPVRGASARLVVGKKLDVACAPEEMALVEKASRRLNVNRFGMPALEPPAEIRIFLLSERDFNAFLVSQDAPRVLRRERRTWPRS
jgi:hypothetical protein